MIGQKGVPATHGGVERHVEELGARLVELGHEVTVFTRPGYTDPSLREYRGMRLVSLPTVSSKHLDAIVHSIVASFAVWFGRYDVVHYHAIGPCLASPIARIRGRRVVATIHGQNWRSAKWGPLATMFLRLSEWMALRVPNETISVSRTLAETYRSQGARTVHYIPNGISVTHEDDPKTLGDFGVAPRSYILFAGRLAPEKGIHYLIEAHAKAGVDLSLVVVGGTSNSDEYVAELHRRAGDGVVFTGYQYGARLATLFRNAAIFVLPSDHEGLPIVLLEALAYGVPVLASDIPPNIEVLGSEGEYFLAGDVASLAARLRECASRLGSLRGAVKRQAEVVGRSFDWNRIADQTVEVYESAASGGRAAG